MTVLSHLLLMFSLQTPQLCYLLVPRIYFLSKCRESFLAVTQIT